MQSSNLQREVVEGDQDFGFERNKLGVLLTKKSATSLDFSPSFLQIPLPRFSSAPVWGWCLGTLKVTRTLPVVHPCGGHCSEAHLGVLAFPCMPSLPRIPST